MDDFLESLQGGWVIVDPKIYIANFGPLYKALKTAFRKKCSFVQFSTWIRAGPKRKVVLEKVLNLRRVETEESKS